MASVRSTGTACREFTLCIGSFTRTPWTRSPWILGTLFYTIKRPEIISGLLLNLSIKAIYVSSNYQIGILTYPGRRSSRFRQHNRKRPRHDNSMILMKTFRFFYFYLFCSYIYLLVNPDLFPVDITVVKKTPGSLINRWLLNHIGDTILTRLLIQAEYTWLL